MLCGSAGAGGVSGAADHSLIARCTANGRGRFAVAIERLAPLTSSECDRKMGHDDYYVRCFLRYVDARQPFRSTDARPSVDEVRYLVESRDLHVQAPGPLRPGDFVSWAAIVAVDGRERRIHLRLHAIFPRWTFGLALLATPLRTRQTPLLDLLLTPARASSMGFGYLTLDLARRVVCLLENDELVGQVPVVGIWVDLAGASAADAVTVAAWWDAAEIVDSPLIWAACARFLRSLRLAERVWIEDRTFLVMAVHRTAAEPAEVAQGHRVCLSFFEATADAPSPSDAVFVAPSDGTCTFDIDGCAANDSASAQSLTVKLASVEETLPGAGEPENPEEDVPPPHIGATPPQRTYARQCEDKDLRRSSESVAGVVASMEQPRAAPPRPHPGPAAATKVAKNAPPASPADSTKQHRHCSSFPTSPEHAGAQGPAVSMRRNEKPGTDGCPLRRSAESDAVGGGRSWGRGGPGTAGAGQPGCIDDVRLSTSSFASSGRAPPAPYRAPRNQATTTWRSEPGTELLMDAPPPFPFGEPGTEETASNTAQLPGALYSQRGSFTSHQFGGDAPMKPERGARESDETAMLRQLVSMQQAQMLQMQQQLSSLHSMVAGLAAMRPEPPNLVKPPRQSTGVAVGTSESLDASPRSRSRAGVPEMRDAAVCVGESLTFAPGSLRDSMNRYGAAQGVRPRYTDAAVNTSCGINAGSDVGSSLDLSTSSPGAIVASCDERGAEQGIGEVRRSHEQQQQPQRQLQQFQEEQHDARRQQTILPHVQGAPPAQQQQQQQAPSLWPAPRTQVQHEVRPHTRYAESQLWQQPKPVASATDSERGQVLPVGALQNMLDESVDNPPRVSTEAKVAGEVSRSIAAQATQAAKAAQAADAAAAVLNSCAEGRVRDSADTAGGTTPRDRSGLVASMSASRDPPLSSSSRRAVAEAAAAAGAAEPQQRVEHPLSGGISGAASGADADCATARGNSTTGGPGWTPESVPRIVWPSSPSSVGSQSSGFDEDIAVSEMGSMDSSPVLGLSLGLGGRCMAPPGGAVFSGAATSLRGRHR